MSTDSIYRLEEAGVTAELFCDNHPLSPDEWDDPSDEERQQYAEGDVYGYVITLPDGSLGDSLWSLYGFIYACEEMHTALRRAVNEVRKQRTDLFRKLVAR